MHVKHDPHTMLILCHLSDLWLLDLQELEYCLLKQRKTHTGTMQTLCKYFHILTMYGYWMCHVQLTVVRHKNTQFYRI